MAIGGDEQKALLDAGQAFLLNNPKGKKLLAEATKVKGDVTSFVNDAKQVKAAYEKYKPSIVTFTTKGRVYDQQTNEPIQGVKVQVFLGLYPMKLVAEEKTRTTVDPITNKKIKEKYTDYVYVYDSKGNKEIKTDAKGEFNLRFGTVVIPNLNNKVIVQPRVLYSMDGYAPAEQTIISGNGEVLQMLPIKSLLNIDKAAEIQAEKIKQEVNNLSEKIANIALDATEKILIELKNRVLNFAKVIQNRLFPLAIGLLILFGITKLAQMDRAKCPNNALLKECIRRRNSIVRQLNQIYGVIILNTALAGLFLYLSTLFTTGKIAVGSIPFPVAVPPGVGVPYSLISKLEKIQQLFEKLSDINKELKKALIIALIFLIASLILILLYLKKIDELINKCSDGSIPMTEINNELLALTAGQTLEGEPVVQNVNGFKMDVVVDENSKQGYGEGVLYSRYAVAKNSTGVVILKGEPSFSADPQILIDELSFYIRNNNLKAD
jgi:hypothetical protein